jgi:hypothetical protein
MISGRLHGHVAMGDNALSAGGADSYPRCGAEACSAPLPAAFDGSAKPGNLTFIMQLSANQGLLPFGQNQKWAISNASLALLLPVLGASYSGSPL